jgi:hypothetical protein
MKTASWVLLTVVGVAIVLVSLLSARLAYVTGDYNIGPAKVAEVAGDRPAVASALRGMRGTAAAYAAAYGVLFLSIVLGPYRRGEVWCWWALLWGALALEAFTLARIPLLGTQLGVGPASVQLALVVVGLLLDVGRLKSAGAAR